MSTLRVADDPPGALGSPIHAGVSLPGCWMEGLLATAICSAAGPPIFDGPGSECRVARS
jgi:hypothetical protein